MTVHFVCRGNVFRSIVAEAYLRSLLLSGVTVLSSGTVAERDREVNGANFPRVRSLLARHKLEDFAKDHYGDPLT